MQIRNAKITPGIHPRSVNKRTINIVAQPLFTTANGGKIMHRRYLMIVIKVSLLVAFTLSVSLIANILSSSHDLRYFCPKKGKNELKT